MEEVTPRTVTKNLKAGVYDLTPNMASSSSDIWERFEWVITSDKKKLDFIACKVSISSNYVMFKYCILLSYNLLTYKHFNYIACIILFL